MTVELSYAGRNLRILPPREAMRIERYMSTSDLHEWDQRDFQNGIGHLPLPEVYYPNFRLGSLWWPTGASKFAVGRYVITQSDLDVIGPLALPVAGPVEQNLILSYGSKNITTGMFLLPPRPIFQTQTGPEPMYFITLVDKRFYWWYKSGTIEYFYLSSWATLLSSILLQMGESSALIDQISVDYGIPSVRWISKYQFLPMLLDAACFACGLRCVRKMDGSVHLQNICNAKNINAIEIQKAYPGEPFSGSGSGPPTYIPVLGGLYNQNYVARSVPSSVKVIQSADEVNNVLLSTFSSTSNPALQIGQYSGIVGFDGTKVIFGDPNGDGSGSGSGSGSGCCNDSEIGYNRRIAKDWYCWQLSTPDVIFRELVNWDINGLNEYVEIRWTPEQVTTEVRRPTINNRASGALVDNPLSHLRIGRSGSCSGSGAINNLFYINEFGQCIDISCSSGCGTGGGPEDCGSGFVECCGGNESAVLYAHFAYAGSGFHCTDFTTQSFSVGYVNQNQYSYLAQPCPGGPTGYNFHCGASGTPASACTQPDPADNGKYGLFLNLNIGVAFFGCSGLGITASSTSPSGLCNFVEFSTSGGSFSCSPLSVSFSEFTVSFIEDYQGAGIIRTGRYTLVFDTNP